MPKLVELTLPVWLAKYVRSRYGTRPAIRGRYILLSKNYPRDMPRLGAGHEVVKVELQSNSVRARLAASEHLHREFDTHLLQYVQAAVVHGGTVCGAIRSFLDRYDIAIDEEYQLDRARKAWQRSGYRKEIQRK